MPKIIKEYERTRVGKTFTTGAGGKKPNIVSKYPGPPAGSKQPKSSSRKK